MQLTQKQYDKLIDYAKAYAIMNANYKYVEELKTYKLSAKVGDMNLIEVLGDRE